ncbi:hypothetical protein cyc_05884 [Cyclospora cayetanensis]|uniref:Uncharacterized protein n=1 Tax=Cyclospora cayetanensis TaxID=88456 RepID=A0A1D3DAJ4_9EIME|nr:hypothetical protein cyc_05884 [Cyclospora cayetanensis]
MSIPLITWEAPEPEGPLEMFDGKSEENPLLHMSLEEPAPCSLFVVTGGLVSPRDILSFFLPFNPLHVEFLLPHGGVDLEGNCLQEGGPSGMQQPETACVVFPSPAAAASALQQRSSPCDFLLQRHKEQLQLAIRQQEELLEGEAEEGEVDMQQQQQQQLASLKDQLSNIDQTVAVASSSDGKSYQLLLRRTAAADLPAASPEAAADPSRVVQLRSTLNFTLAAAAASGDPLGPPSETAGIEERALLQDTVAVQACRGQFRSFVLRGTVDSGEGPSERSQENSRVKLTPRAEAEMDADRPRAGGPSRGGPSGRPHQFDPESPPRRDEAGPPWEHVEDRLPRTRKLVGRSCLPCLRKRDEGISALAWEERATMRVASM